MKRRLLLFLAACLVAIGIGIYIANRPEKNEPDDQSSKSTSNNQPAADKKPEQQAFNSKQYSLTDPNSIWVVVNKTRPLQPKSYAPDDLTVPDMRLRANITSDERQVRKTVADALYTLSEAAKKEDLTLTLESGYRSYNFQTSLYNRYVSQQGQATADTQSARPGYSEHQTGLAADLGGITQPGCNVEDCYATTPEGKWLAANAYKYGFIIRYPEGKTATTGYIYEPWHVRYVGDNLVAEMHNRGIQTLEEFFDLPAAPDYN